MIIQRVEHPDRLSNAYLVADHPGGRGVLITAITASPTNFSTVPPCRSRVERISS